MKSVKTVCGMWQTEIFRQWIWVEGRRFTVADREELCRLAVCGPEGALRDVYAFLVEWFSDTPDVEVQTSGSTGVPKRMRVEKRRMVCSACRTCGFLSLKEGDTALLCMNMKYIGAKMMVVRALVAGLRLMVRPASGSPLSDVEERVDFLSVVPMQLYRCVQDASLRERLSRVRCVIVGGGARRRVTVSGLAGTSLCDLFHLRHDRDPFACGAPPSERAGCLGTLRPFGGD